MSDTTYKSKVGYKPPVELEYHEGTPEIKSVWDNMRDAEGKILGQVEEHVVAQCSVAVGVKIDRDELIKALRYDRGQYEKGYNDGKRDVIEALQAEVQFYDALASEWQASAENKERLLELYRAERYGAEKRNVYNAMDNNGRIIENPFACMNIPVFPDSSESPNS